MLQPIAVPHKHLVDYASIVGRSLADVQLALVGSMATDDRSSSSRSDR
jgi:hypothetical protein